MTQAYQLDAFFNNLVVTYLAFEPAGVPAGQVKVLRFSQPKAVTVVAHGTLESDLTNHLSDQPPLGHTLTEIRNRMTDILRPHLRWMENNPADELGHQPIVHQVAYLASVYFGCATFLVLSKSAP